MAPTKRHPAPAATGHGVHDRLPEGQDGRQDSHRAPPPQLPMVVAAWPRNTREVVRITIDKYQDTDIVDVRCWYRDAGGILKPGRSGISLSVRHLPVLADGLAKARDAAIAAGLIE